MKIKNRIQMRHFSSLFGVSNIVLDKTNAAIHQLQYFTWKIAYKLLSALNPSVYYTISVSIIVYYVY